MLQEIITYIIVSASFGYAVRKFVKFFKDMNKGKSACSSCSKSSCRINPHYSRKVAKTLS